MDILDDNWMDNTDYQEMVCSHDMFEIFVDKSSKEI